MKTLFIPLLLAVLSAAPLKATDYFSATQIIRMHCDTVVYGVVEFTDETAAIHKSDSRFVPKYHLIKIRPYRFLPDISPRYFQFREYPGYVREESYEFLRANLEDYRDKPRFWGIRRGEICGNTIHFVTIQPSKDDEPLANLEESILSDLKDPRRIRPLDLSGREKEFSLTYNMAGEIVFTNRSKYSVWLHEISGEYRNTGKNGFAYSLHVFKEGSWDLSSFGRSGPYDDPKFNLSRRVDPGDSVSWNREPPKKELYEVYQVHVSVYPDESRNNPLEILSNTVSP